MSIAVAIYMFSYQKTKPSFMVFICMFFTGIITTQIMVPSANANSCIDLFAKIPIRNSGSKTLPSEIEQMLQNLFSGRTSQEARVANEVIKKISNPLKNWEHLLHIDLREDFKIIVKEAQRTYIQELLKIVELRNKKEINDNEARALIQKAFLDFSEQTHKAWGFFSGKNHNLADRLMADQDLDNINFVVNHPSGLRFWADTIVDPRLSVVQEQFSLTREEYLAIEVYKGPSDRFNKALRANRKGSKYDPYLRSALMKIEPYRGVVFRDAGDIGRSDIGSNFLTPGNIVYDKGFMSTSREYHPTFIPSTETNSPRIFMIIISKTGRSIENLGSFKREKEVLFLPGTRFRVVMVHRGPQGSHTVYLDEVL